MSLYNFSRAMAQSFHSGQRAAWMMAVEPAVNDYTESRYGETILWPRMMNGGPALAPQAWTAATVPMNAYPYFNAQAAIGTTLADLATVEAVDGSATKCLEIVARHQLNTPLNQLAFLGLRFSQNDDGTGTNSQIEQLNMLNASHGQAVNEARSQSMIQSCEVQQQIIAKQDPAGSDRESSQFYGPSGPICGLTTRNVGRCRRVDFQLPFSMTERTY
jgi:type IV secretion system protein TrbJ